MTLKELTKALIFIDNTESNYTRQSTKFSHRFNYAMLQHCIYFNFELSRPLYKEAFSQHPNHPVIARAYAIFLLASRDPPRQKNFDKARGLFLEAEAADPDLSKFKTAQHNFFRWAVVSRPDHPVALLNYALLHQCVLKDFDKAEKIYGRALALDPTNVHVVENFRDFESRRYPGGLYAGTGPSGEVLRRSRVVEERPEWGEWKRMLDDESSNPAYGTFWYDAVVTKVTSFTEPHWNGVWKARVERSRRVGETEDGVWTEYWDSKLETGFFYNRLTEDCVPNWGVKMADE